MLAGAVAHHRAGRLDEAARGYDDVLARDPDHAPALSMKGVLALQQRRPADAVAWLERAIAVDARPAGFHLNLGNALRAVARSRDAAAAYRRALEIDPEMAPAHNNLGNALRDQDLLVDAAAAYRRAVELQPDFFAAAANLAQVEAKLGTRARAEILAAHDRALALADAANLRGVEAANLHNGRGNLLQAEGRFTDAIEAYRRAIELDPAFGEAHLNLGQALARELRLDEAVEPLRRGLALHPTDLASYKRLAVLLRRLRRNDEAAAVYRAWHARDPGDPIAAHMARATTDRAPPARAAEGYVMREFDEFADAYDDVLVDKLGYRAPKLVADALRRAGWSDRRELRIVDVGCGTGLCVDPLRPLARRLVGVDLSAKMLDKARARGGYDELVEAELCAYLEQNAGAFDLIVATDVMIYLGALEPVAHAMRRALRAGGVVVFTAEAGTDDARGWTLGDAGRYLHGRAYLRRVFGDAGFAIGEMVDEGLRHELGEEVRVWLVTAVARD
jgi:predicted TPR repeat methyltransferase